MRKLTAFFFLGLVGAVLLAGCGGASSPPVINPGPQSAQVSVSLTDAPPAGVTVFTFEVSVTGATLNPGNVDVLAGKGPIRIEVKKLETENAFLSTANVTAGNYTSLNLTFSNPELTFLNGTPATLAGCASGSVCEIKPSGTLSATVNGQFSSMGGSQTGVLVDLNLANLLTPSLGVDFSAASAVTATQQTKEAEGELEDIDDVDGIVANPASGQFTLQTTDMGNITVTIDSNTQFEGFDTCAAANATCIQTGQSVEVDLMLLASGGFLAKKVELEDDAQQAADDELDGVISKIDGPAQFEMVVNDELQAVANVSVGNPVTVMLTTSGGGTSFQVDTNGLTVPSSLQQAFEAATDTSQLLPGQTVQVRKLTMTGGPAPAAITITTDRVRLRDTRFTATISGAPSGNNFNVGGLPGLFTAAGITQIQVQTSSQTDFENVSGVSGLADGSTVSLRGLLFTSTPNPVLIADKVRKR
ncbi:MAG TPA: DUF5666 domain-containing protein [Candidatus Acidoferrum sp.]